MIICIDIFNLFLLIKLHFIFFIDFFYFAFITITSQYMIQISESIIKQGHFFHTQ